MIRWPVKLCWLLPLAGLAGCSAPPATTTTPSAVAVRDDLQRPVLLPQPLQRIATIGPGVTEMVCSLGGQSLLVGRDQMSVYPPAVRRVPEIGSSLGPSLEKLVAVRPQLLLLQGETYSGAQADAWQKRTHVPVAVLNAHSVAGTVADIEKVSLWLGPRHDPQTVLGALSGGPRQASDAARLRALNVSAFFEVARSQLWTGGDDTLVGDELKQAGLINAASSVHGYKQFSMESLLAHEPAIYVVAGAAPGQTVAQALRELRSHPTLRQLKCVQQGQVVVVPADLVERSGPRLGQGIRQLTAGALACLAHG